jgi:hypothetical protein
MLKLFIRPIIVYVGEQRSMIDGWLDSSLEKGVILLIWFSSIHSWLP